LLPDLDDKSTSHQNYSEATMAEVIGLGHVGIYVRDLERMAVFYRDTLGMRVTKQNWRAGIVFLSADPEAADHEIALFRGRPDDADSRLINQIFTLRKNARRSARLPSTVGCRRFADRRSRESCERARLLLLRPGRQSLGSVLGHGACWVPLAHSIDIDRPDEAVLAEVDQLWERLRHVDIGERMANEPATLRLD
jgi:catechol 2,3-dioxygenase-like lactoylglutathione lyase family enzyme